MSRVVPYNAAKTASLGAITYKAAQKLAPYVIKNLENAYYRQKTKNILKKLNQSKLDKYYKQAKKDMAKKNKKTSKKSKSKTKTKTRIRRRRFRSRFAFGGRPINVKNDKEGYSKTVKKTHLTKQQYKKVKNRFKGQYSPFKDVFENGFQETIPQSTGKCKWTWRCYNTLDYIGRAWKTYPYDSRILGTSLQPDSTLGNNTAINGPLNEIIFYEFKTKYEIFNPTNYDMNLIIYDIVCKEDTEFQANNANYNIYENPASNVLRSDPIKCIEEGLTSKLGQYTSTAESSASVSILGTHNQKKINDITLKPTESQKFNIYWKIVKKHTFKLQPGATMTHVFKFKPVELMNRGYWAYRYGSDTVFGSSSSHQAIKRITSGCLFKYWGQVAGTSDSTGVGPDGEGNYTNMEQDHTQVTNLSGRIMFREFIENRWYVPEPKYTFTFKHDITSYKPTDEEDLEVIGDDTFHKANDDMQEDNTGD